MLSKFEDLAQAVINEMEKIRVDVMNWNLAPTGIDRVLYTIQVFDAATTTDIILYGQGQDRRAAMLVRLDQLQGIKLRAELELKNAQNAEWLSGFVIDTAAAGDTTLLIKGRKATTAFPS